MPTIATAKATWDTGLEVTSAELRRADSAAFLGDGATSVRGGVVRHGPTSLAVSVNASDQVTVQAGTFVVPAATGLGVYRGSLQAATSAVALTPRNGTNPRIDLVVIQVGTGTGAIVKTIDGNASSSPSPPSLPAQHIEIGRLNVPPVGGTAVTVDSTWRQYATSLGGVIPVETAARLPGSGNQMGQRATALDTGRDYKWLGSAWVVQDAPISANATYDPNASAVGPGAVARKIGGIVTVTYQVQLTIPWSSGYGTFFIPDGFKPISEVYFLGGNATTTSWHRMRVDPNGTVFVVDPVPSAAAVIVGTVTYPVNP